MKVINVYNDPNSCLSHARDDEMVFVLLARDVAAPTCIRTWINTRVRMGKNNYDDPQMLEAAQCAKKMEEYQRTLKADG